MQGSSESERYRQAEWVLNLSVNTDSVSSPDNYRKLVEKGGGHKGKGSALPMFQKWGETTGICFWMNKHKLKRSEGTDTVYTFNCF